MAELRFRSDEEKDAENQRKHGVGFEEVSTVFAEEYALLLDVPDHSEAEDRFVLLGLSAVIRIPLVCYC